MSASIISSRLAAWLLEFYFEGEYEQIVHGPENHFEGIMVAPATISSSRAGRSFLTWKVEWGSVLPIPMPWQALGQDFNFSFSAGAGAKYNITCDFYARLGLSTSTSPMPGFPSLSSKIIRLMNSGRSSRLDIHLRVR